MNDPLRYFRVEARDLADQLGRGVLDLDGSGDAATVVRLLRLAHTLKGAARVVRQPDLADRAHQLEDVLVAYRDTGGPLPPDEMSRLFQLTDEIAAGVDRLAAPPSGEPDAPAARPLVSTGAGGSARGSAGTGAAHPAGAAVVERPATAPPDSTPPAPGGPEADHAADGGTVTAGSEPADVATTGTVAAAFAAEAGQHVPHTDGAGVTAGRAPTSDVDELLDAVGEAHARFTPLRAHAEAVRRLQRSAETLADQLRAPLGRADGATGPADFTRLASATLAAELARVGRRLTDTVEQVERELDEVRGRAERLRLVAASTVFTVLHRAVRDAAQAQQKRVVFEGRGGDLRIDPQILAQASSALLHVVRNAVAHGIESAEDRLLGGKPVDGRVVVEVVRRGRYAVFRCHDDGRGFDLDAVRRTAASRGLIPPGSVPGPEELVELVLRGGISTSRTVTEVSGRGIGLDVVRDMAEQVGGDVAVSTAVGAGSTVQLSVPLTLLSLTGLVIRAGETVSTVPLDAVRTCVRLDAGQAAAAAASGRLPHEGEAVPYVPLALALGGTATAGPQVAVLICGDQGDDARVAVGADQLLGTTTLVVRPLPELAPTSPAIGGVSLDVEGHPRPVLDPGGLVDASVGVAARVRTADAGHRRADLPILVVDDSLTTRMLERSILESAGYQVDLAASAEEALVKARLRRYGLFLTDIDMPGMDGFEFVARTRDDPDLAGVPAILVSSRDSDADRQRGVDVGASAYVVKGEFDQEALLAQIRALVTA